MDESLTPAVGNGPADIESAVGGMRDRFRGFLPVVVDIETGGFNCQTDAILEIAVNWSSARPTAATSNRLRVPIWIPQHSNSPA